MPAGPARSSAVPSAQRWSQSHTRQPRSQGAQTRRAGAHGVRGPAPGCRPRLPRCCPRQLHLAGLLLLTSPKAPAPAARRGRRQLNLHPCCGADRRCAEHLQLPWLVPAWQPQQLQQPREAAQPWPWYEQGGKRSVPCTPLEHNTSGSNKLLKFDATGASRPAPDYSCQQQSAPRATAKAEPAHSERAGSTLVPHGRR